MERLTKAGIVRIVSKAAQGRSARKAIDWTALAAAERDSGPIQNFEIHRSGEPRITAAVNLESPARGTLIHHGDDSRITTAVTDPISDQINGPFKVSDPEPDHDVREPTAALTDDQPAEPPMPPDDLLTGSRPATDTDPIDNDGATTPPSVPAVSSPRCGVRSLGSSLVCDREPHTDGLHECGPFAFSNDFYTPTTDEVSDGQVTPHHAQPVGLHRLQDAAGPVLSDAAPETAVASGDASTLTPAPATSGTSASIATESGSLPLAFDAPPPAKAKRKAKAAPDETQIAAIAADVERAIGSIGRCKPGSMRWKQLANAVKGAGVERMAARIAAFADAVQGLPSPAAQTHRAMASKGCDVDNLLWAENGWTLSIDKAIEDAAISRSEAVAASGGMPTHPSAPNAQERQPAPKQTVSWPDVLRDLGSDPDHHPEDGPLRSYWPRVREAIYSATKTSGDAWLTWCRADDTKRQRVERVLSLVTA